MDAVLDTLHKSFAAEAKGYVSTLRGELEDGKPQPEAVIKIFNQFQILAGGAQALQIDDVAEPASLAVQLLQPIVDEQADLSPAKTKKLNKWLDQIDAFLATIPEQNGNGSHEPKAPVKPAPSFSDDLLTIFAQEAAEHGETIQAGLTRLQANIADQEAMRDVRRATHTLKGAAASVGIEPVAELAHLMEDLLEPFIEADAALPDEAVALLLETADAVDGLLASDADRNPAKLINVLIARYEQLPRPEVELELPPMPDFSGGQTVTENRPAQTEAESAIKVPLKRVDQILNQVGEVAIGHSTLEGYVKGFQGLLVELDYSSRRLHRLARDIESQIEVVAQGQHDLIDVNDSHFDPLELDRYTTLYQLTRGLEEVAADTTNVNRELQDLSQVFDASLSRERRLTAEIQDHLMSTRMVPFNTIETRLRRTVRQTARDLGKNVDFALSGQDVLLDKTVLDALTEALLHLIRNGIDHGLESPEGRRAASKPDVGLLSLDIKRERGRTILRLSDDGAGIDPARVRQRALALGLITETQELNDERVIELLFEEDFSLAEKVTHTSGRGIGLNIVRRAIKLLQGTIRVESAVGKGTTFVLSVPVTLAVARTLTLKSGDGLFAVPLEQIAAVLRLTPEMLASNDDQGVIRHEGRAYSVFDLTGFTAPGFTEHSAQRYGLVIEYGDQATMVLVDGVMNIQETVIKSLGNHLRRVRGLSGATITGHGEVVLILDLIEIVSGGVVTVGAHSPSVPAEPRQPASNLHVLVIDDSLSVRRAVCLTLEQAGWQTTTAKDGIEALEKLLEVKPDVALVDIEMPRMNGFELLARIRSDASLKMLPVVFLTSRASSKHRDRAHELGCDGYMVKPYRNQELLDELSRAAAKRS